MNIAIRVDASLHIGTGHVMRCLTLAEVLRAKGARVVFISRELPEHLRELVAGKGIEVVRLGESGTDNTPEQADPSPLAHASWLGTTQSSDAIKTITAMESIAPWDWAIVDHYSLDYRWESAVRRVADRIMVIDDLADRKHDCDLLLDQNYFQDTGKRYQGLLPDKSQTLLGPKYALLRPEFRQARKFCRMRGNGIARVLIYFGGNDPDNLTGMALGAMNDISLCHLLVDAVIGPNSQHQAQLEKQAANRPGTYLHIQPEGFTELMLRADICIGAGGSTTWERLCLGLPSLVITVAENQVAFTVELDRDGLVSWIGRKKDISASDIRKAFVHEIEKLKIQALFSNAPAPVDGLGALRVAEKIFPSGKEELSLRKTCREDMDLFYCWANDPFVRENSFQKNPISWHEHVAWFNNKLESGLANILVMQTRSGLPVGQIRFDRDQEVLNISYSLDPIARGRGWGGQLIELGSNAVRSTAQGKFIQGKVKTSNPASMQIFRKHGYTETLENGVITFRKSIQ
ncbi:UDP-2,4-diacetamido-2,4,6-trideoxy-beta-L-altropyranose hydrolase [Desulfonatronum thiodismutans]|uniref:UDP-2,4-diacetamido-2,4, 6-trideoxy-beta-L-altropyranose hydrolase n=1 Tax=Desulfonatronum thiodismutans TaxID=159290 RepID=UPI0006920A4C|nr:UDP-2,4-diacetamido-2,4,6-trideoxy-beta-L-altropyranose hydrolase [Desulfonatronum thiodismutans]